MKWIIDYQNNNIFNDKYSGYVVHSFEYSTNCFNRFKEYEIKKCFSDIKLNGKESYLCVDKFIMENELDSFKKYLNDLNGLYDYLIFSDLAVLNIVNEKEYGKLLYDPKTLISSSNEYSFYKSLNIDSFIANEISLDEIKKITGKGYKINMMVKGRALIMYSRRPLVSLYKEFSDNDNIVSKDDSYYYYLKEELRDEFYPCVENENGTFIFSDYIFNALDFIDELKDNLNIVRVSLDSFTKGDESIGFLSKSSILLKGDKNE